MRGPVNRWRNLILLLSTCLLLACSMATGSIPAVLDMAANVEPFLLLDASNTPFLPARDTATAVPTDLPTATWSPAATETMLATIPWTATTTATQTMVILPSVTATSPLVYPTQARPTQRPQILPTQTPRIKAYVPPPATDMVILMIVATETPTATATVDPATWTATATLSGSETATPLPSATSQPTATVIPTSTPIPTATRTATSAPPSIGCATFNFEWEAQVAELLNQERAKYGLPAWRLNSILTNTARAHSVDMVVNRFMSHTGSDGRTPKQRIAQAGYVGGWWGEIIAGGNPTIAVNWWMNEPGHRAQIINTHYTDFGVGYAYCPGQGWFTVDQGGP